MFSLNGVTLRPLEFDDIDTLYAWDSDSELEMYAGWGPKRSRAAYRHRYERRILMDYAFTVRALERLYAEVYTFNTRSQRLFEGLGFQQEGILRQHEFHNGSLRDMYVFGLLKPEFYQRYETIFKLPG